MSSVKHMVIETYWNDFHRTESTISPFSSSPLGFQLQSTLHPCHLLPSFLGLATTRAAASPSWTTYMEPCSLATALRNLLFRRQGPKVDRKVQVCTAASQQVQCQSDSKQDKLNISDHLRRFEIDKLTCSWHVLRTVLARFNVSSASHSFMRNEDVRGEEAMPRFLPPSAPRLLDFAKKSCELRGAGDEARSQRIEVKLAYNSW